MASVEYQRLAGGQRADLLFENGRTAAYHAVTDLAEQRAEPVAITWWGRVVLDAAAIARVYAACAAEQRADRWQVPPSLEVAGRRALGRPTN